MTRMTRLMSLGLAALLVAGCSVLPAAETVLPSAAAPTDVAPDPTKEPVAGTIPLCDALPVITAPAHYFRDAPIYVANEMPTDRMRVWAARKPGFEDLWIDREHHGWIALAFSVDAEARQGELESEFPDVGVVAVQVHWKKADLEALQQRVADAFRSRQIHVSMGTYVTKGVVSIGLGILKPELVALAEDLFGGERVCLSGMDPAQAPVEGPQQIAGDGWRLLADADGVGPAYRTGIAYDDASYDQLRDTARLDSDRPAVDFESEVAIWFGAVTGSSCPNIRLDDVVVNHDRAVVYAEIVNLDFGACTADIHSHAYVVALERARLPSGPFAIQLNADGPPRGAPEERTVVDVDLSQPWSIAQPGEVHGDTTPPEPHFVGPGDIIENGFPADYRQSVLCGMEWLGPLNDVDWRTDAAAGEPDRIPVEWSDSVVDGQIVLRVLLTVDPPRLEATANGHSVTYEPTVDQPPLCP